jgi:hypothetical protein
VLTQTDVKVRWADGSIKHAVVSAVVTPGRYPVTVAEDRGGSYTPVWPSAQVSLTIGGTEFVGEGVWLPG